MQHCCSAAAKLQQLLLLSPSYIARSVSLSATQQADATVQGPYISQPVQHVEQVPVPLSRRPAQHTAQLSALMQWRQNVLDAIKQIKDTFVAEDEGPSTSELQVGCWQLSHVACPSPSLMCAAFCASSHPTHSCAERGQLGA